MDSKWPFMLITFGLLFALGMTISSIEKGNVMKHWDKRRCDFTIMTLGMFFKPEYDPRSSSAFAKDNFSFCMKSIVERFMEIVMAPVNVIFGQHVDVAGSSMDGLNILRGMTATMYDAFQSYMAVYWKKFNTSVFEMSRIVQYLGMAMRRLNAVMMSFIYAGITLFRTMLNTVQFIIRVILIMCGVMLAIMIILFFILFPFIPMILVVLGIVIYNMVIINNLVGETSGGTLSTAKEYRDGFCFSKDTQLVTKKGLVSVSDISLGDELGDEQCDYGKVTAIMTFSGKNVTLYNLDGIYVSGSHLVKGDTWHSVSKDSRAIKTTVQSNILYCFNTTSNTIPIHGSNGTVLFRDWEEIAENDKKGQYLWNYIMLTTLNHSSNYSKWKDGLTILENIPLMNATVKTNKGFVDISTLRIHDTVLDRNGKDQVIYGIVKGQIDGKNENNETWHTELYEYDGVWIKGESTFVPGNDKIEGTSLITETGEFIIMDGNEKIIRDFTEIGYQHIHETYPFVESRLNGI